MAFTANAVGRVRTGGSDTNGAFYDSSISGAGTDYSQQDAAQLSLTDIACSASTTVTSATGGFTSAMIGNAIRITGGGATSGYYFITARTDTNTITVDRTPGTVTGGTGKVGGAAATWQRLATTGSATGDKVVAGNTIYIRGSGSDAPSSDDYTTTGFVQPPNGDTTSGRIKMIGENGRPRLKSNGLMILDMTHFIFENLYLTCSSNSSGSAGVIRLGANCIFKNCIVNTANQTAQVGIFANATGIEIIDCEIFGNTSSPTSSSGCYGIQIGSSANNCKLNGCFIHHCRDAGIYQAASAPVPLVSNCHLYANVGNQIEVTATPTLAGSIIGNVIDAGSGHGIHLSSNACLPWVSIYNNTITNHTGGSKNGLNVGSGTTTVNDKLACFVDYNNYYNNTGNYNGISAGPNDRTLDPGYTNAAAYNWTQGTNLKALGWPGTVRNTATAWYVDIGVQRQEAGGASQPVGQACQ